MHNIRTRKPYMELFRAMNSHVEFHLEFCTDSSSDSVSIALPVIDAFVVSARHSLSQAFVTSTMNCMIFLGSNKITCFKNLNGFVNNALSLQHNMIYYAPLMLVTSNCAAIYWSALWLFCVAFYQQESLNLWLVWKGWWYIMKSSLCYWSAEYSIPL